MDWFRDNKFVGAWLVLTLLIALVLGFLLLKARGKYNAAKTRYTTGNQAVEKLKGARPFPSKENLELKGEQVGDLRGKVEELRQSLVAYQRPPIEIAPAELQTKIKDRVAGLKARAEENGVALPETFNLDLGQYISQPPSPRVCPMLDIQVDSLEWLAAVLIDSGVSSIDTIDRGPLPVETPSSGGNSDEEKAKPVLDAYPTEITFTGGMASVENFFNRVTNAEPDAKMYHVIRLVRLENTTPQGPDRIAVEPRNESAGDPGFDDPSVGFLGNGSEEGVEDAAFIFGEEEVRVFAEIELVRFSTDPVAGGEEEAPAEGDAAKPAA